MVIGQLVNMKFGREDEAIQQRFPGGVPEGLKP
jgi:hypothetical protein